MSWFSSFLLLFLGYDSLFETFFDFKWIAIHPINIVTFNIIFFLDWVKYLCQQNKIPDDVRIKNLSKILVEGNPSHDVMKFSKVYERRCCGGIPTWLRTWARLRVSKGKLGWMFTFNDWSNQNDLNKIIFSNDSLPSFNHLIICKKLVVPNLRKIDVLAWLCLMKCDIWVGIRNVQKIALKNQKCY